MKVTQQQEPPEAAVQHDAMPVLHTAPGCSRHCVNSLTDQHTAIIEGLDALIAAEGTVDSFADAVDSLN